MSGSYTCQVENDIGAGSSSKFNLQIKCKLKLFAIMNKYLFNNYVL